MINSSNEAILIYDLAAACCDDAAIQSHSAFAVQNHVLASLLFNTDLDIRLLHLWHVIQLLNRDAWSLSLGLLLLLLLLLLFLLVMLTRPLIPLLLPLG